jgi:YihY family inner membrane protein
MRTRASGLSHLLAVPGSFALRVLRSFRANQGLLLAAALAYYLLLSIVPLLILILWALSRVIDRQHLLATLGANLDRIVPGQSSLLLDELARFSENHSAIGWVLLASLLYFSSQAFSVLEKAMSVIFLHRIRVRHRHFMISAIIPYFYILVLGLGLLVMTLITGTLEAIGAQSVHVLGHSWSLHGLSGALVSVLGLAAEIAVLTSIYAVMPVGRPAWRHALIGASAAALLWEVMRLVLVWYFSTLSTVSVVYGSLTTAIVVLTSFDVAAILLLLGAQVIAEYERLALSATSSLTA